MKRTESVAKTSKSSGSSNRRRSAVPRLMSPDLKFVVCIKGAGVDLEPMKVYKVIHDPAALTEGLLRVVDGSGEDYLYPAPNFLPIAVGRGLLRVARAHAGG